MERSTPGQRPGLNTTTGEASGRRVEESVPRVCTPAQRTGLNITIGGVSGRRVECEHEEDVRLYVNVDDLWNLVAG